MRKFVTQPPHWNWPEPSTSQLAVHHPPARAFIGPLHLDTFVSSDEFRKIKSPFPMEIAYSGGPEDGKGGCWVDFSIWYQANCTHAQKLLSAYRCLSTTLGRILRIVKMQVTTLNFKGAKKHLWRAGIAIHVKRQRSDKHAEYKSTRPSLLSKKKNRRIEMSKCSQNAFKESEAWICLIDTSQCCLAHMLSSLNKIRFSLELPLSQISQISLLAPAQGRYYLTNPIMENRMHSTSA